MRQGLTILVTILLCACGEPSDPGSTAPVWKSQTDVLDSARQVEGIVQDQADAQRRQLESMTQ